MSDESIRFRPVRRVRALPASVTAIKPDEIIASLPRHHIRGRCELCEPNLPSKMMHIPLAPNRHADAAAACPRLSESADLLGHGAKSEKWTPQMDISAS